MSSSATPASSAIHQNVVPSEVGWQFVPQYYNFVNKHPNRLHCFYTKSSTFFHGTEGEEAKPCFGQQEIHNKITSLGFDDCKVFIHSVDAQSSANGGIIIQVIGEMSNRSEPWRKFVQTFFLAEQPNGYFVLNDIFRFLNDETVEEEDVNGVSDPVTTNPSVDPESKPIPEVRHEPTPTPVAAPATSTAAPSAVVDEAPTTDVPDFTTQTAASDSQAPPAPASSSAKPNGFHHSEAHDSTAAAVTEKPQQPLAAEAPAALPPAPAPTSAAAPAPPPAAPRTWAALAASGQKKWGPTVAQEARGVTEVPVTSSAPSSGALTPASASARAPAAHQPGAGERREHPNYVAAQSVSTRSCFIKGVTDVVSLNALRKALEERFGPVMDLEVVHPKSCAFVEFQSLDAARRAIITSLPLNQGGEGGVVLEGNARIFVETKKERGERPNRGRGGPPPSHQNGGRGRGRGDSFRGHRGGAVKA